MVAATLSSAGGELLQLMPRAGGAATGASGGSAAPLLGFDAIIVDEAAQVGWDGTRLRPALARNASQQAACPFCSPDLPAQ